MSPFCGDGRWAAGARPQTPAGARRGRRGVPKSFSRITAAQAGPQVAVSCYVRSPRLLVALPLLLLGGTGAQAIDMKKVAKGLVRPDKVLRKTFARNLEVSLSFKVKVHLEVQVGFNRNEGKVVIQRLAAQRTYAGTL